MENESTHTGRGGVPKAQTLGNHVTATAVVRSRCSFISVMEAFQWFMQNFDTHLTIADYLDYKILQVVIVILLSEPHRQVVIFMFSGEP